ncbi:MAG: nucleotidyl transferase AbiEii/AbiGii toxin family protein [Cephaloticoccus sp.]|nr:nucleotidyl transferase AbiEii/AbiGii toxin family protein [Cephaloticoccus sp.]
MPKKNLPASVKARLLTTAQQRGDTFNQVLVRYGVERLLYRLSQSAHRDKFLLKGAMLFAVWDDTLPRPTRDVDFLSFAPAEIEVMKQLFRDIAQANVPDDGLQFDAASVQVEEILDDDAYGGVRVRLLARLGKAKVPLQIDVGSGDAVTPTAEEVVFPALLDFPAPQLRAYPIYTVVAEKFEAMVKLDLRNTRMKDFHDLWYLSRRFEFDGPTLHRAVHATFARRQTELDDSLPRAIATRFAADEAKQVQWTAFLNRNGLTGSPANFAEVMDLLREFLGAVSGVYPPTDRWIPSSGWSAGKSM